MAIGESLKLGSELKNLRFDNNADWWFKLHDFSTLWQHHHTYCISAFIYLLGALLTFIHAMSSRGRWPYLWFATVFHGLVVESLCYVLPDVDNFWHSQTPIMLLGRRLPLHIMLLYPCFIYQAQVAVSKLRLPRWAEPCAVGLTVVLIDLPYDIMCVKFAHWTWHDTDPNIGDRHYWVPWNSYYFHTTFAAAFTLCFHSFRDYSTRWHGAGVIRELFNVALAALFGTPLGVLLFTVLYHPFHDVYKVHSEVTFFALFAVFLSVAWAGSAVSKQSIPGAVKGEKTATWRTWLVVFHLVLHYAFYLYLTVFGHPEREVAVGLHEPIGDCSTVVPLQTASGLVLQKRKYLCKTDYDEAYFDFHCLPGGKAPSDGSHWYTICGTPFENRAEYFLVILTITVTAFIVFFTMHFRSSPDRTIMPSKETNSRKVKMN